MPIVNNIVLYTFKSVKKIDLDKIQLKRTKKTKLNSPISVK